MWGSHPTEMIYKMKVVFSHSGKNGRASSTAQWPANWTRQTFFYIHPTITIHLAFNDQTWSHTSEYGHFPTAPYSTTVRAHRIWIYNEYANLILNQFQQQASSLHGSNMFLLQSVNSVLAEPSPLSCWSPAGTVQTMTAGPSWSLKSLRT